MRTTCDATLLFEKWFETARLCDRNAKIQKCIKMGKLFDRNWQLCRCSWRIISSRQSIVDVIAEQTYWKFKEKQPAMFKNYLCVYILDMSNTTTKLIRRSILDNACPDAYASSAPDNNGFRMPCRNIEKSFRRRHRNGARASWAPVLRNSRSSASVCPPREVAGSFCDIWHENIQRLCYVCLSFPCCSWCCLGIWVAFLT